MNFIWFYSYTNNRLILKSLIYCNYSLSCIGAFSSLLYSLFTREALKITRFNLSVSWKGTGWTQSLKSSQKTSFLVQVGDIRTSCTVAKAAFQSETKQQLQEVQKLLLSKLSCFICYENKLYFHSTRAHHSSPLLRHVSSSSSQTLYSPAVTCSNGFVRGSTMMMSHPYPLCAP